MRMVIEIEKGAKKEDASKANDAIPGLPRDPGIYYKSSQAARTQLKEVEAAKTEMQRGFATLVTGIGSGRVKITVVSSAGKEAVLAVLGPHDFLVKAPWSDNLSG